MDERAGARPPSPPSRTRASYLALAPGPERIAQSALRDLSGTGLGQLLLARNRPISESCSRQSGRGRIRSARPRKPRRRPCSTTIALTASPQLLVGHADHRDFEHRRMRGEHVLDLDRIHVLAAADDHVLLAIDDEKPAAARRRSPCRRCDTSRSAARRRCAWASSSTRASRARRPPRLRRLGPPERRSASSKMSKPDVGHGRPALLVSASCSGVPSTQKSRRIGERGDARGLRDAVAVEVGRRQSLDRLLQDAERRRRAAVHDEAQAREIVLARSSDGSPSC